MEILKIKTPERLLGNFGERTAARYLRKNGYKIRKKKFVANSHEIDIIAEDRNTLVFVEVKTRTTGHEHPNEPRPASSVDAEKQRSIIQAARVYTAFNRCDKRKRFDIIEVFATPKTKGYSLAEIKHLQNTFNLNTAFSYRKDYRK